MNGFAATLMDIGRTWPARHPLTALRNARALLRQRRDLAELDDHILRDIGVSREAAQTEAARPIWDAPEHWRQ